MGLAFIIMQIGNAELDKVCETVIVPALEECGLDAKRVDKHNEGGLLKNEIIRFIESPEIIIADLTNERPNCYLEIGYAMGIDKFRSLILTAREDHMPDYPDRKLGGPKVHFDLSGYDVLFWKADHLDAFRIELEKKIRRRKAILAPPISQDSNSSLDSEWFTRQAEAAKKGFIEYGKKGLMELKVSLETSKPNIGQHELLDAASKAVIRTFGWPIGAVMTKPEYRPRPTSEGIVANIGSNNRGAYDYWSLRRNADYYFLGNLFEDTRRLEQDLLFINTRIVQVTEAFLHTARLYSQLQVPPTQTFEIAIRHGGLEERKLAWASMWLDIEDDHSTLEDEHSVSVVTSQSEIEGRLTDLVKTISAPLFTLFNFFVVRDDVYSEKVNNFVAGRVT